MTHVVSYFNLRDMTLATSARLKRNRFPLATIAWGFSAGDGPGWQRLVLQEMARGGQRHLRRKNYRRKGGRRKGDDPADRSGSRRSFFMSWRWPHGPIRFLIAIRHGPRLTNGEICTATIFSMQARSSFISSLTRGSISEVFSFRKNRFSAASELRERRSSHNKWIRSLRIVRQLRAALMTCEIPSR